MSNLRIQLTTNASPKLVDLVHRAARGQDQKVAEFVRGAIVQRLRADGIDVASELRD